MFRSCAAFFVLLFLIACQPESISQSQWFPAPTAASVFSADELKLIDGEFHAAYDADIAALGGVLEIKFFKLIPNYLAFATKNEATYQIAIMGGNLDKALMDRDSLRLLICHEMGHFLGGGPKRIELDPEEDQDWNVVEGGADYFATLQCMKRILPASAGEWKTPETLSPIIDSRCREQFEDPTAYTSCVRSLLASEKLIAFFGIIKKTGETVLFTTPDPKEVEKSLASHPEHQCRLDTLLAGALCSADPKEILDGQDLTIRGCEGPKTRRPRCWFQPSDFERNEAWAEPTAVFDL